MVRALSDELPLINPKTSKDIPMGKLTTHVLDTSAGLPGAGIDISIYKIQGNDRTLVKQTVTNADGRCDEPLLQQDALERCQYELVFSAGAYFSKKMSLPEQPFLDDIVIRFGISDPDEHYHVPLLVSPYGYSTYRGS